MNLATKAALFSALLFPGWGHIFLKKYKRGIFLIISVSIGIIILCYYIVSVAIDVLRGASLKKGDVSFSYVINLSAEAVKSVNQFYIFFVLLFIIILWIFSIYDSYSLGKKEMEKITSGADQSEISRRD